MSQQHYSSCGCCRGTEKLTPEKIVNRPGLSQLSYRAGTHATFLETMKARLSSLKLEDHRSSADSGSRLDGDNPLGKLSVRESDDPAIAMLDAWATVGDVLTFYQERIANEGYLRTATERRSIADLVRLTGYTMRPGVSASTFLALTLEKNFSVVLKPNELKAQSVPGPGQLPQIFENNEEVDARGEWNTLYPRKSRPQNLSSVLFDSSNGPYLVYLKGLTTNLRVNDPLLFVGEDMVVYLRGTNQNLHINRSGESKLYRVIAVRPEVNEDRTILKIESWYTSKEIYFVERLRKAVNGYADELIKGFYVNDDVLIIESLVKYLFDSLDLSKKQNLSCTDVLDIISNIKTVIDTLLKNNEQFYYSNIFNIILTKLTLLHEVLSAECEQFSNSGDKLPDTGIVGRTQWEGLISGLVKPPSMPPRNFIQLNRKYDSTYKKDSDAGFQLINIFQPLLTDTLQLALEKYVSVSQSQIRVYALRANAYLFGYNTPLRSKILQSDNTVAYYEWTLNNPDGNTPNRSLPISNDNTTLSLDAEYQIPAKSYVAINAKDSTLPLISRVAEIKNGTEVGYGISGKSTKITLDNKLDPGAIDYSFVRFTRVFANSEELELADEPIHSDINDLKIIDNNFVDEYELDGLYSELKSGRWLIFSGERTDIKEGGITVTGVKASELVMLAGVYHRSSSEPDGRLHTYIKLAKRLEYSYKRDTVKIYANVVKADHGETRKEILGSGDSTKEFQSFPLRQPPLTYVAATTPDGTDSTLNVMVNDIQWRESETLSELSSSDRKFITRTDDEGNTTIIFGNGKNGARLPSGAENIRATYRSGIGAAGNVKPEQISQLMAKPLGVREVINPFGATGGADKESRDLARRNAPLSVTALDRLVSTQDYADFASTFAGIGKSNAVRLTDGAREIVHLTIAGADDIPINESSDLFQSLNKALRQFGDPYQPFKVQVREKLILIISGKVRILPNYMWESVVTNIRKTLLDKFSFHRRELGEDVYLGEVISTIQSVEGVAYVDIDVFGGVSEKKVDGDQRRLQTPGEILSQVGKLGLKPRVSVNLAAFEGGVVRPAQLAYLAPEVPDTLILNQI